MRCSFPILAVMPLLAAVPRAAAQPPPALEPLLEQIAKYEHGQDRKPVAELEALLRGVHSTRAPMAAIEQRFVRFLESDATPAGKEIICRHLGVFGSDAAVPVLVKMAAVRGMAETARYALERIPGAASLGALRAALEKASGEDRIGWINSLGARRDAASVPALSRLVASSDAAVSGAAADALAAIGIPDAQRALEAALPEVAGIPVRDALLKCAGRRAAEKNASEAARLYRRLLAAGEPASIRVASLRGLASVSPREAAPLLRKSLGEEEASLRAAAIQLLGALPEGGPILAAALPGLAPSWQVRVIAALAGRADEASGQAIRNAANSGDANVRIAALRALAASPGAAAVPLLAAKAASSDGDEQRAARESLYAVRGGAADEAVIAGLRAPDPKVRIEMIRAAGERATAGAGAALLDAAGDSDANVRRESLRALREVAGDKEIPRVIELLVSLNSAAERREAERALMAAVRKSPASWTAQLERAFRAAPNAEAQGSLLQVLAVSGRDEVLPVFHEALKSGGSGLRRAAILALASWPGTKPLPDLFEAAGGGGEPALQVLALRSAIKLLSLPSGRPPAETARLLEEAYKLARQAGEKRAVLAALPNAPCPEALALAERAARDAEVAKEAAIAVNSLRRALK